MYIKLHKLSWVRNLKNLRPNKINKHTVQYKVLQHNETQTYLITGHPSYQQIMNTHIHTQVEYITKAHIAMYTILFSILIL